MILKYTNTPVDFANRARKNATQAETMKLNDDFPRICIDFHLIDSDIHNFS